MVGDPACHGLRRLCASALSDGIELKLEGSIGMNERGHAVQCKLARRWADVGPGSAHASAAVAAPLAVSFCGESADPSVAAAREKTEREMRSSTGVPTGAPSGGASS